MSDKPRILFIIGSMREGGAEKQLCLLMRGLRARGWDVHLMLLHYEGVRLQALLDDGFDVFDVQLPRFRPRWSPVPWLRLPLVLWRSARHVYRLQPEIIHAWLFWAHLWAWLVSLLEPMVLITSRRQTVSDKKDSRLLTFIENRINRKARQVIANSQAVADAAKARERHLPLLTVIPNGLDIDAIDTAPAADLRALFPALADATTIAINVANLRPFKGHEDLIAAWNIVAKQHPGAKILCVGADGEGLRAGLEARISSAGLDRHIIFAGPRNDVPSLMKGADFAVHCSRDEGLPNAVLEYMACARAVVATDAGGTREIIHDPGLGIIVPVSAPEAIAEAVCQLIEQPELRHRMGHAAAQSVRERYSIDAMLDQHEAAYGRALDDGGHKDDSGA